MIPVHFGTSDRRLFGVYSPASPARRQRRGVVLCQPFGDEYLRAHRSCRLLAQRLDALGYDVLRFDYYGSGDSEGDGLELTLSGAVSDVGAAMKELGDLASVPRIVLVGLRLGALVASAAAESHRVDRLVLWDPIPEPARHAEEIRTGGDPLGDEGDVETGGFAFSKELLDELSTAQHRISPDHGKTLLIASAQRDAQQELRDRLAASGGRPDFDFIENPPAWSNRANVGVGAVPTAILERIVEWCGE